MIKKFGLRKVFIVLILLFLPLTSLAHGTGLPRITAGGTHTPLEISEAGYFLFQNSDILIQNKAYSEEHKNGIISTTFTNFYDNWKIDSSQIETGEQSSQVGNFNYSKTGIFAKTDSIFISIESGITEFKIKRLGNTGSFSGNTDTTTFFSYSTFDPFVEKNSGFELSIDVNLPTGKTKLTELERLSTPNSDAVSTSFAGVGFDKGFTLKYIRKNNVFTGYIGGGYGHRGSYDATAEISNDDINEGVEYRFVIGGQYQLSENLKWGLDFSITRLDGYADDISNYYTVTVPIILTYDSFFIEGSFNITHNAGQSTQTTELLRDKSFNKGNSYSLTLYADYAYLKDLSFNVTMGASKSDTETTEDSIFFTTDDKLEIGVGAQWQVALGDYSMILSAFGRRFDISSVSSSQDNVDITGFNFVASARLEF